MDSNLPQAVEYSNQRILTTKQLAELYGTDTRIISNNYNRNKDHYTRGKHFYALEGEEKKAFILRHGIDDGSKKANILYLWTEKGALFHVKSLGTDEAWKMYERLVDEYYRLIAATDSTSKIEEQLFTKDVQARCISNEKLLKPGFWCVVTEMWREAWTLEAFQKELKPSSLPDGSCGTKWRNHLTHIQHPLLSKSYQAYLHIPNNKNLFKVWVYPNDLIGEFRPWLRNEYAEYYLTNYSPSRLKGDLIE